MARILIFLLAVFLPALVCAESLQWPLPFGKTLTGGFADSRPDHFHGGVDLRTGPEHRPVVAPTDGFIERIAVQPGGYGRVLYFRLHDGRTAVFGHLNEFAAPLEKLLRDQQLVDGVYRIDFAPDSLLPGVQFKQGETIAFSGSSGAGPAHLHFEIREGAVQTDPLKNYPPRDTDAPVITGLWWTALGTFDPVEVGTRLTLNPAGSHTWRAPDIRSDDPVAFFVQCYDPGPWNRNAVPEVIHIRVDGQVIYTQPCGRIDLLGPKNIYANLVRAERERRDNDVRRIFECPRPIQWSAVSLAPGWIADAKHAPVEIEVVDRAGNSAAVTVNVTSGAVARMSERSVPKSVRSGSFTLQTGDDPLAAWAELSAFSPSEVMIGPRDFAFGDRHRLEFDRSALRPGVPFHFYELKSDGSKKPLWRIPEDSTDVVACYVLRGGIYGIGYDEIPPRLTVSVRTKRLFFKLTDDASGIDDSAVRCRVDGWRAIAEFDYEERGGFIWTQQPLKRGNHEIEFSAADRAGNLKNWTLTVNIP